MARAKELIVNFLFFSAVLKPNIPKAFQLPLMFCGVTMVRPVSISYCVLLLILFCVAVNIKCATIPRCLSALYVL